MDIHNAVMDTLFVKNYMYNWIMDIHNSIIDIFAWIMDIHNYEYTVMDIHNP